jgi:hypothetical protein
MFYIKSTIKMSTVYESLNNISDNEFENIQTSTHPVEHYLDATITKNISLYKKKINDNNYIIEDKTRQEREVFIKYITLIDFLKYLIGKYKDDDLNELPDTKKSEFSTKYSRYINDHNNYAFVDSFFYYLSGKLNENFNFPHGITCYDSFICHKKNCKINIADDFEYLCDSQFFNENIDKLFSFEDPNIMDIFNEYKKEPLNICEDVNISDDIPNIDNEIIPLDLNIEHKDEHVDAEEVELNIGNDEISLRTTIHSSDESSESMSDDQEDIQSDDDSDDSEIEDDDDSDETYVDDEDEHDDDECMETESEEEDDDEDELIIKFKKMPIQVVAIEKCKDTLDSLLSKEDITVQEIESCIFQVIVILHVYQNKFKFTHNDLHTNNIMYIETDKEFIYYNVMGKTYKIPTYGKIFKIIDFGRAIYEYDGKMLCSDSFSPNGTGYSQYNFEPYYNNKKPVIMPNFSFDLCRLACSMFDFICDDIRKINEYREKVPVYDLIFSWLYDDNNRNILYKSNGEDKYPGFKLYKMITRLVHKHIPSAQFTHKCFEKYIMDSTNVSDRESLHIVQIDELIKS